MTPGNEDFVGEEIITLTIPVRTLNAAMQALDECIIYHHEEAAESHDNGAPLAKKSRRVANEYSRHLAILRRASARK